MINAVSYQFNKFVEFAEERVETGKREEGRCENGTRHKRIQRRV